MNDCTTGADRAIAPPYRHGGLPARRPPCSSDEVPFSYECPASTEKIDFVAESFLNSYEPFPGRGPLQIRLERNDSPHSFFRSPGSEGRCACAADQERSALRTLHRVPPVLVPSWLLVPAAVVLVAVVLLEPSTVMAQDASTAKFTYLFHSDAEGWTAGFADLPVDHDQQFFELDSVHRQLPTGSTKAEACSCRATTAAPTSSCT